MIGTLQSVVLDCHYPAALARFYAAVLGGEVDRPDPSVDEDWSTLHTPDGQLLAFQRVADFHPPQWPDPAHPQQFHLDIAVPDLDAAEREVVALGAAPLQREDTFRVYTDPAGHPFCLVYEPATGGRTDG
ncbi:VOC family protein [Kitasatospora mediocidica]|uniref:VOC family protein n=1 Tax=Kitasatospora mediocidica TaxID=58352 RepID=UPI00055EDE32|nr:VOC family protein [Kitasatospora mediocidica]